MLPERDRSALEDMLTHAREATEAAQGRCESDLQTDRFLFLGLQWLLAVVGEAAGRVSVETRATLPSVPWTRIVGMRNRLIHGYDTVLPDRVWDTVTMDLPSLVTDLQAALATGAPETKRDPDAPSSP